MYQNALAPPAGAAPVGPPPLPAALPQPPAEAVHRKRSEAFAHAAIADFMKGGITRQQLADALADHEAYDYGHWKREQVVHPSRAVSHGVAAEEAPPTMPTGGLVPRPSPTPIMGAGSI